VVPPSPHLIQRYEARPFLSPRASSQENKAEPSTPTSPKRLRPLSKDSKRSSDTKKDVKISSYGGRDEQGPEVWVSSWIDYSRKYGLGYLMSNNSLGAIYNDDTHLIAEPSFASVQYISGDKVFIYKIDEYPSELYKKVMLLHLFRKLFASDQPSHKPCSFNSLVFLKKWTAAQHAYVFRITNKIVQICFKDTTEILLCSESKHVTYVNKAHKIESYTLNEVMESGNKEVTKRIKYSREILMRMQKND
jgi:polo-like kinase 1